MNEEREREPRVEPGPCSVAERERRVAHGQARGQHQNTHLSQHAAESRTERALLSVFREYSYSIWTF